MCINISAQHNLITCGIIPLIFFAAGCTSMEKEIETYDSIHQHAVHELPWTVSLESKFPHTDHFITHYGMTGSSTIWNSVSYFGERYELTIQVNIKIDYNAKAFQSIGTPKGYLVEVGLVRENGGGKIASDVHLSDGQLAELIASNWEFQTIGILLNPTPVENFATFERSWRAPRRAVSLVKPVGLKQ